MDEIEDRLAREFPGVEVLIHTDPEGLVDETGDRGRGDCCQQDEGTAQ